MAKRDISNVFHKRTLRSAKGAKISSSWASLPPELRLMILEEIAQQRHRGWSSCAAVCKEWQTFVERQNFHQLKLRVSCLEELQDMVIRQRGLVKHIWLNIEFPRYTCRSCRTGGPLGRHITIITRAIHKLFSILSTWKPTGRLILEINAYSPSGAEHWFKNYQFGAENEDNGNWVQQQEATNAWHDPDHGWVNGYQFEIPSVPAILGLFSPLFLGCLKDFPKVHAVTGLVILRQLRRQVTPDLLQPLLERLPRLESIVFEPWRICKPTWKMGCDQRAFFLLSTAYPIVY